MQPRTWGVIALIALAMAAVLFGITVMWQGGPEASDLATPTATAQLGLTSTAAPTATSTPTRPITYSVQTGDTLSAIAEEHEVSIEALVRANDLADPDVLQVGQVLVIPRNDVAGPVAPASTETPKTPFSADEESVVIPPTFTPSGPPLVEIVEAIGVGNLEDEVIALSNQGGMVSLEAWTLSNSAGNRFVFPPLTLFPEGQARVHSTGGDDTPRDLYWGRTESAWQKGELVTLRDADGNVVDTYVVPR